MTDKKYPIGGFAPGNYYGKCHSCGKEYRGDKRSIECEECGEVSERFEKKMIEVLQFISEKHDLKKSGKELKGEYLKHIYDTFMENKKPINSLIITTK